MKKLLYAAWLMAVALPAYGQCFYWLYGGKVMYKDGTEQVFNGMRCMYSGRLYWSRDAEVLKKSYTKTTSIDMDAIARVDFSGDADGSVRQGTVTLRNGEKFENIFLYAGECRWARFEHNTYNCDDKPIVEADWTDPSISAIVITRTPKSATTSTPKKTK
jgi:hypothetical protein